MASEADASEFASLFEAMMRDRDISLLMPFILGLATAAAAAAPENPDQQNPETPPPRERIILINPFAQPMVVIEGDSLLQEFGTKDGQPPASQASIAAMPSIKIAVVDGGPLECVICLEEFEDGGLAREMPCKHRFHGDCIEKWLKLHGSCPVCRYVMPVEAEEAGKKGGDGRRRGDGEIRVSFFVNASSRASEDSDQTPSAPQAADDHHDMRS